MHILEFSSIFLFGAIGYGSIEVMWRGYTHWTMLTAGGLSMYIIYLISTRMRDELWKKMIMCACSVSALEFSLGCLINLRLGWSVWDYSDMPLNLMGQICPQFSAFWMLLSLPCILLSQFIYRFVFLPNLRRREKSLDNT